jgi:hypothetical protein
MHRSPIHFARSALFNCLAICTLVLAQVQQVYAQQDENVAVVWELTETEAEQIASKLEFDGEIKPVDGEEVRGAPLVVLIGIAVLPSLVDSLITFYRDMTQGGVIIDASGEQIEIVTDKALPYGTILVRDGEGVEVQNFRSTPKPADLSSAIAEAVKATAAK